MKKNMSTQGNSPNKRKIKKFGDSNIFYGAFTNHWFLRIISKPALAIGLGLHQWFKFNTALMAWSVNSLIKFRFGYESVGFIMYFITLFSMLVFNSQHVWLIFNPIMTFVSPAAIFIYQPQELYNMIFIEIHSVSMLVFIMLYTLFGLVHVIMVYARKVMNKIYPSAGRVIYISYYPSGLESMNMSLVDG